MNKNISDETILDLLVGGKKSEESLAAVLNFLTRTESLFRHLYLSKRFKKDIETDSKYLGFLNFENDE